MTLLPWVETKAFAGRVVVVTGAGRGIGLGLAERFGQAGAAVTINDVVAERVTESTARLRDMGIDAHGVVADITRVDEVERLFDEAGQKHGRTDIFVSSAGFHERRPLFEIDEAYWDRIQGVNLKGPFFCLQAAARRMVEQHYGRVVLLTSIGAHAAQMHLAAYSAAKAGEVLLAKAAGVELADRGVTVNAVGPGAVEGPWNKQFFDDPDYARRWKATAPMRRMASNDDIASTVMFLASEDAGHITGQTLYVDGGKTAYIPGVDFLREALDPTTAGDESGTD